MKCRHALCLVLWCALACAACGVAPIHRGDGSKLPPTWTYAGRHGRPLAFGGGVCALTHPHAHPFPPSPRTAFAETAAGARDRRPMWAFFDAHPHHGRTCNRSGWHLHLEPPDAELTRDAERGAWRAAGSHL